jgi:hypothetical protein
MIETVSNDPIFEFDILRVDAARPGGRRLLSWREPWLPHHYGMDRSNHRFLAGLLRRSGRSEIDEQFPTGLPRCGHT